MSNWEVIDIVMLLYVGILIPVRIIGDDEQLGRAWSSARNGKNKAGFEAGGLYRST